MKIENVVYIITNPQYPGYVKIGYASDLKSRISSLNTGALVEFEPYAAYETPKDMADIEIHEIIKLLNPILRASKFEKGKVRQKEFFKLDPEEAFQLLEHIAIVSGTRDKLYKVDRNFNKYDELEKYFGDVFDDNWFYDYIYICHKFLQEKLTDKKYNQFCNFFDDYISNFDKLKNEIDICMDIENIIK